MNNIQLSEHQIQNAILEYLAYNGVYAWRNNVGLARILSNGKERFIKMGKAGLPDIIGVLGKSYRHYGRMLGIEVKRPGKKTSPMQDEVIGELSAFGAYVFVAYSVDDVEEQLQRLKLSQLKG